MKVNELSKLINANNLHDIGLENEVKSGYTCDLLSWVMARGDEGCAWVTVQTHMNVVAVASLKEMACIILPDDITMEEAPLNKAKEEGVAVLSSPLSAYSICAIMDKAGLPSC